LYTGGWEFYSSANTDTAHSAVGWINESERHTRAGPRTAVWFYSDTNTTWFRNLTFPPANAAEDTGFDEILINLTGLHLPDGPAFFGAYTQYSLGNLTMLYFQNSSSTYDEHAYSNRTTSGKGGDEADDEDTAAMSINYFSTYNNTDQTWITKRRLWNNSNATLFGKASQNGLDVFYTYISDNISLNLTYDDETNKVNYSGIGHNWTLT